MVLGRNASFCAHSHAAHSRLAWVTEAGELGQLALEAALTRAGEKHRAPPDEGQGGTQHQTLPTPNSEIIIPLEHHHVTLAKEAYSPRAI